MLRPVCLLLLAVPAVAGESLAKDHAAEAIISDLIELREQVGGADGSASDQEDFSDAMRGVLRDASREEQREARPPAGQFAPSLPLRRTPRLITDEPFGATVRQPARHWDGSRTPVASGSRSPVAKLRLKAFDLDRVAHELEMANLGAEADAVREVAKTLRLAARKLVDAKRPARARPTGSSEFRPVERPPTLPD